MKQPVPPPEPEQPKRQPVPIEPVAVVVDTTRPKRTPPPLDEDGYRQCAREGCPEKFRPLSRNPRNQEDVTEFYCSTACAEIEFRKTYGLEPRSSATSKRERAGKPGNGGDPVLDAGKEAKYGPVRAIAVVVSEKGGRVTVKLAECGHQMSVKKGRKQARCRKCKTAQGSAATAERPKRQPVTPPNVHDTTVKRQPVTAEAVKQFVGRGQRAQAAVDAAIKKAAKKPGARAKKPKRTPVKAVKKSARKKGRR